MLGRFLALLLLAACSGPSEYHQGAPVARPPAPPLRPGLGAPVVGQPGAAARPLPRSPNTRLLPPSSEPGLWSADRPKEVAGPYTIPSVLGFTPPAVEKEEALVAMYAGSCAQLVNDTTRFPSVSRALVRASEREVMCIGARAYFGCLGDLWIEVSGKKDRASVVLAQVLLGYQQRLQREVNETCKEMEQTTNLTALLNMVKTALTNSRRR